MLSQINTMDVFNLFLIGGWIFWVSLVVLSVVFFVCLSKENVKAAGTFIVIAFVLYSKNMWAVHWWMVPVYIAGYFLIGVLWSFPRWILYNKEIVIRYRPVPSSGIGAVSQEQVQRASQRMSDELNVTKNKSLICLWMVCWPWSIIHQCTYRLVENVFNYLSGVYHRISVKAINNALRQVQ